MISAEAGAARRGRYAIHDRIAAGGMASVHFGVLRGPGGFRRVVAVKRLHAQFAHDPEFVAMFLDEARMASRVRHLNVVTTLDVVQEAGEILLIMDYIAGEALSRLMATAGQRGEPPPPAIAAAIAAGVLHGLHAAHEARSDRGEPLDLVHRDVSPQNVLVGADGVARVVDFGIAKATGRSHTTRDGQLKGKMPYMAPEQLRAGAVSRQSDVWSAAVVLWEMLTGERLFDGENEGHIYSRVVNERAKPPSRVNGSIPPELDAVVMRGLMRAPERRFATAREMALALEECVAPATAAQVGAWVEAMAHEALAARAARLLEVEQRDAEEAAEEAAPVSAGPVSAGPVSAGPVSAGPVSAGPVSAGPVSAGPASAVPEIQPPPSRRRPVAVLVGVGLALSAGFAGVLAMQASGARPPGEPATASASETLVAATASAAAPASAPAPAPASAPAPAPASAPASAAAPASVPASASAPARASAPASAPARGSRPARPAAGPGRDPRCYTLDKQGIWHIKPECL